MTAKNKKILVIAAAVGAAVIIYHVVKTKTDTSGTGYDPTGNGGSNGSSELPFNANSTAEKLYEAMRNTGTDEEAIFAALKNITQQQFAQVITAFQNRSYNSSMGNQVNYAPWSSSLPLKDLPYWLKNELSSSDYNKLRLRFPNHL